MLADEVIFCIIGLELCAKTGVQLTSHTQLNYQPLGWLIDEPLVTLQLAGYASLGSQFGTLRHPPRMGTLGWVSSSVGGVAMEGCGLASGPSTLCSEEASLPLSGEGVA